MKLTQAIRQYLEKHGPTAARALAEALNIPYHRCIMRLRKLAREGFAIETAPGVYRMASADEYIDFVNRRR